MTRVLCVTANYPPHSTGGYELSCRDVMDGLARRGHDVTVLTSNEVLAEAAEVPGERGHNPAIRRDIQRYFHDNDIWVPSPWQRWRIERHNQRVVADAIAASAPEVAAVWHLGGFSIGVVTALIERGIPVVYAVCDDWLSYCQVLDQWAKLVRRLGRLAAPARALLRVPTEVPDFGASGPICFVSESVRRRSLEYTDWTYPGSVIVYSCLERGLFSPKPRGTPWQGRLLCVGRYDPRKGMETLVRAVALLDRSVTLVLRGSGSEAEEQRLRDVAAELGLSDRVDIGRAPRDELPALYRAADAFVFPSEWDEPFGLVPLEAMACGTPVIATGTGGTGEFLVDGGNCVLFDAGDPLALSAAVERLASDAELRDRLYAAGLRTAAYFDAERLTDVFEAWYDAAAAGYPAGYPSGRTFVLSELVDG